MATEQVLGQTARNSGRILSGNQDVLHQKENGIDIYGILGPGENERRGWEGAQYTPTGMILRNSFKFGEILSGKAMAKG